ncbi:MerR family transcriptional regulator [Spirillospora sp. CA-253888]
MRIGALADRAGVSRRLLRYYEEQGLLRPLRLANGYREYDESDVATVRHIRVLLAAGLPTAVIARLLDCVHDEGERVVPSACPGVVANLQRERGRITEEIARLESSRRTLDTILAAALERPDDIREQGRPA